MRIKSVVAITLISLAVACSSVTGPDLVRQYAECLGRPCYAVASGRRGRTGRKRA